MGKRTKPAVELTADMIQSLPAAGIIAGNRNLKKLIQRGLNAGKIQSDMLIETLNTLNLSDEDEAEVYGAFETLGIPILANGEGEKFEEGEEDAEQLTAQDELPNATSEASLNDPVLCFLHEMGSIPLLSPEETLEMAKRVDAGHQAEKQLKSLAEDADQQVRADLQKAIRQGENAKKRIVEANLRLVVSVAKRYASNTSSMSLLDLVQEGSVGLMKAVDKYDYKRGFKFSTYATWWVRQAVSRAVVDQDKCVRIPVHMMDTMSKLNHIAKSLPDNMDPEDNEVELARRMVGDDEKWEKMGERRRAKVVEKVHSALQLSRSSTPISLDQPVDESSDAVVGDFICDTNTTNSPEVMVDKAFLRDKLDSVLEAIPARESKVLRLRFGLEDGKPRTLEEIGREFRLTRERIRQIESTALKRLRLPRYAKHLCSYFDELHMPEDDIVETTWEDLDRDFEF